MITGGGSIQAMPGRRKALNTMAETTPPLVDVKEPKDLLGLMVRRWWVILLGIAVGAGIALGGMNV